MSPNQKSILKIIASENSLYKAWRKVRSSCVQSLSDEIHSAALKFDENASTHIKSIQAKIVKATFAFPPARGVMKKRPGKQPRPLVVAPIISRIVQRSILDTLWGLDRIRTIATNANSYGGIEKLSTRDAIERLSAEIRSGARFYYKSDIMDFFTKIPTNIVLDKIFRVLPDDSANGLLKAAIGCELANAHDASISDYIDAFPRDEIGVVQGCCLSPLFGNILLGEFDMLMNSKESIHCIRYIDDFIIVGDTRVQVERAGKQANKLLDQHGLSAYVPKNSDKASIGPLHKGVDFLGCSIWPGRIRPGKKAKHRLLSRIKDALHESTIKMDTRDPKIEHKYSLVGALCDASNIIKGWGNSFSYCSDTEYMDAIDSEINTLISSYLKQFRSSYDLTSEPTRRRKILGVHLLSECKKNTIL